MTGRRIVHISRMKRQSKRGLSLGGVEKWAMYLNRALGDQLIMYEWADYPEWATYDIEPDHTKAYRLNHWLLGQGLLKDGDTILFDGYWGNGLEAVRDRFDLVGVVHGSYTEMMLSMERYPWPGFQDLHMHALAQEHVWRETQCRLVSVSEQTAKGIKNLADFDSTIIMNGVDLEVFRPMPELRQERLVLHAITDLRKGRDVLPVLQENLRGKCSLGFLGVRSGILEDEAKRWNEGVLTLFPSKYEGCSYAALEAAACGVPQLTYATGQAMSFDFYVGRVIDDLFPQSTIWHLLDMLERLENYAPRRWAEKHASYERFAQEWRVFLDVE